MITITIDQDQVEFAVRSLAQSHNRTEQDIIVGALAQQLGIPELVHSLHFSCVNDEVNEYGIVAAA